MNTTIKILIVEHDKLDLEMLFHELKKSKIGYIAEVVSNEPDYTKALKEFAPDIILSDYTLPSFDGLAAFKIKEKIAQLTPFILVTGTIGEERAVELIKMGVTDYTLKEKLFTLIPKIKRALYESKERRIKNKTDLEFIRSEEKYRTLVDQAFDGIMVYSIDGVILDCNHTACDYIGYTRKELKQLTVQQLFFDEDLRVKPLYFETLRIGHPTFDYRKLKRKDGSYLEIEISTKLMPDGNLMAIARDITEKKIAEKALQVAYERLSFHLENAPLGFIEWDEHLHVKSWSKRAEEIFGWSEKEFISIQKSGYNQVYTEDIPWVSKIAEQLISGEIERNRVQHRNYTKDGKVIWCEWFNSVLKDKNGKIISILSLVQDITARKKIEQDLLNTRMRLEQAQEVAHLGNWLLDFEAHTSKWSDEAYRIYGMEPGDHNLTQNDWMSFVHPDDLEHVKKIVETSSATLNDIILHHRIVRKDGTIRHIYSEAKFELNSKGKPVGLYGVALDITEIRSAEEERKKLELQLSEQRRKEQLKITATALEAQEKERTAIGQELHDNVNQILAATKMQIRMLKASSPDFNETIDTSVSYIQQAIEENRRIAHALVTPDLEMESLVEQLKTLTESMLGKAGLNIQFFTRSFEEDLLDNSQKIAVYRIAQEQCTNIIKYANATVATFSLGTSPSCFKMVIADDGKGMEKGKKIEGIGLRNINSRLSVYNGSAKINTAPGKGFSLEVEIPLDRKLTCNAPDDVYLELA